MKDILKTLTADMVKIWSVIIIGFAFVYFLFIQNLNAIQSDNQRTFENSYSDMSILLKCKSNKFFITDDSEITCSVAAKSESWNYTDVNLIIQAFKADQQNNAFWGCFVNFSFIGNNSYTNFENCKSASGENIITNVPTNLEFRLYEIGIKKYELGNITLKGASFRERIDDKRPFSPILRILPKEFETNAKATNDAHRLVLSSVFIALLTSLIAVFVPFTILIRQIQSSREERLNKQTNLLRALMLELKRIQQDSEGFDKLLQNNKKKDIDFNKKPKIILLPQYPIKSINSPFYIRSLDNEIKGKKTEKLKDTLVTISDKIWLINDSLKKLRSRNTNWYDTVLYYSKIDKRFGKEKVGHAKAHLDKTIEDALNILRRDFQII